MQTINVQLNKNGVIGGLLQCLKENCEMVSLGLGAVDRIDGDDLPKSLNVFAGIQFGDPGTDNAILKRSYKSWMLRRGFEECIKGIKVALIEAYSFIEVLKMTQRTFKDVQELQGVFEQLRKKADKTNIPDHFSYLGSELASPLDYGEQILSINNVRNCLVHRNGIIAQQDLDPNSDTTSLKWTKFFIYYEDQGREIELFPGIIIDGGSSGTPIKMRQEKMEKQFKVGDQIEIDLAEYNQVLATCFLFGNDLVSKLPMLENPGLGVV